MATIEKRNGKYRARVRINGRNLSKTFVRKADATAWALQMEVELYKDSTGKIHHNMSFGDLLEKYLVSVTPTKKGVESETYRLRKLLTTYLASIDLNDLSSRHFAQWRDVRSKYVSPDSVRRELAVLSAVCEYAVRDLEVLESNPVRLVSRPKKGKPRNLIPSDIQIAAVVRELGYVEGMPVTMVSQRVALAVLFAVETAMRAGEICNLTWDCVFRDRRVAHLSETKNGSSRDVPLSRKALAVLDVLAESQGRELDDRVFRLLPRSLGMAFRRARDRVGADFRFHDLRHKALTCMADKVEPMQLAKISGHKDLRILLNTYYNPDIGKLADLLD